MAFLAQSVTLEYSIVPPAGAEHPESSVKSAPVLAAAEICCPITVTSASGNSQTSQYYGAASTAIQDLQAKLNEALTAWKAAIGDGEKAREDMGKVAYGQGRATRMTTEANQAASVAELGEAVEEDDGDEA